MKYQCPVCFYDGLPYPPSDYHICLCCGTEFGSDDQDFSHAQLMEMWIASGAGWFFRTPPVEWSPWVQLQRSGIFESLSETQKRGIIDSAFSCIQKDADGLRQETLIAEEFSRTDWEAFEISERELAGIES
jgi:hypothetical protein